MNTPTDATARDRIANDLASNLFVDAGAGAGKTTALIQRITNLITSGVAQMDSIAAITFTEAAAAELRDRLRESLEATAAQPASADTDIAAKRAAAALRELDQAAITTLHGFAQRILSAYPIEAGLPPQFEVLDGNASLVAFTKAWEDGLAALLDHKALSAELPLAFGLGITLSHLEALARILDVNWDRLTAGAVPPHPEPPPVDITGLLELLDEVDGLTAYCTEPDDKLLAHVMGLRPLREQLHACADDAEILQCLVAAKSIKNAQGRADAWGATFKAAVVERLAAAEDLRASIIERTAHRTLPVLFDVIREFVLSNANRRRVEGVVSFHDLLVRSRDLLRTNPAVAAALHARYTHLLIDEFQDTDPIQAELTFRIAGTVEYGNPWHEATLDPGRVFFVGDPKQAIYRFRRADIGLYLDTQALFPDGSVSLTTCFRSLPPIIDWVNAAFTETFGEGRSRSQPHYEPLAVSRPTVSDGQPRVIAMGGSPENGEGRAEASSADEVRRAAAADIAALIRQAVHEQWPVGDEPKPIRFRDIAILVPTRTGIECLTEALDQAEIPYERSDTSLAFANAEVVDLLAVMRAVAEPANDLAVVAALRTPIYACSDEDLIAWKLGGGSWSSPSAKQTGPVATALMHIQSLHEQARWSTPSQLLEQIIDERDVMSLLLDRPRFRDSWRRVRWLTDQARSFTEVGGRGLHDWLHEVDVLADEDAKLYEVSVDEEDDDAVKIQTIHKSKGLEFGMVVLANLSTGKQADSGVRVLWEADRAEVSINKQIATEGFGALSDIDKEQGSDEEVRLLYVAATRARDYLVLPLHHGSRSRSSWAAKLWNRRSEFAGIWAEVQPLPLDQCPLPARPPTELPDLPITTPEQRTEWTAARSDAIRRAAEPKAISPTLLAAIASTLPTPAADTDLSLDPDFDPVLDDLETAAVDDASPHPSPHRRGRGGTALGKAVHTVLQLIDFADPSNLEALAHSQATAEGLPDRYRDVARLVGHALSSPSIAAATTMPHRKEMYVAAPVGEHLIEGFVDLLIEGPDGLTVVDYKTALGASPDALAERASGYEPQAVAYALVLERILNRPVARAVFVFLDGTAAVEHDVPDLQTKVADLAAVLDSVRSAP